MSVAFRREGDEEHKEPRFELPIPPGPNWVTPRGLALIAARVAQLEAEPRVAEKPGEPDPVQRELRYWRTRMATAQVAPTPPPGRVGIGSRVRFTLDGRERDITIVGDDEADPAAGLLSFAAPLSRALIDAEVGDLVDFAGREAVIELLAVAAAHHE